MEVSWVWSWLNRLSSNERLGGLTGPEPEALHPTTVRAPTTGFDSGFEFVGGALMPRTNSSFLEEQLFPPL